MKIQTRRNPGGACWAWRVRGRWHWPSAAAFPFRRTPRQHFLVGFASFTHRLISERSKCCSMARRSSTSSSTGKPATGSTSIPGWFVSPSNATAC